MRQPNGEVVGEVGGWCCKGSEPGFGCIFCFFWGYFEIKFSWPPWVVFFFGWTIQKIEFGFSVNDMGVSKK